MYEINRTEVLHRAQTIWSPGSVAYDQSKIHQPDGYRQDCSGYLSLCWKIPLNAAGSWGGMNTVSLVTNGWMHEIAPDALKPGDAIGKCGPYTAGDDGHIQLFTAWLNTDPNDSHYYCLEQAGGSWGPAKRLYNWPSGYKAYRFRGIVDDVVSPPPPLPPAPKPYLRRPWPSYMPRNHYFGLITGPNESHGGYYSGERADVKAIQDRLNSLGYNAGFADGLFEPPTRDGVSRWQRAKYASTTTRYGEVWSDDWAHLFTY